MDIERFASDLKHIDGTPFELTDAQRRTLRAFADGGEDLAKSFRLVPPARASRVYGKALAEAVRRSSQRS